MQCVYSINDIIQLWTERILTVTVTWRFTIAVAQMPQQRLATKEDYIYIPLKGPATTTTTTTASTQPDNRQRNNNNMVNSVSQKPPLPKQPPRVVHASVKRDQTAQDTPVGRDDVEKPRRRRRTTIDSGTPIPRMEEPMGLIETDLDTEVTVITSGNHVKTRSLLNLGADPRAVARHLTAAGEGKARPHKSMEFLLDKQNLKVVEVSTPLSSSSFQPPSRTVIAPMRWDRVQPRFAFRSGRVSVTFCDRFSTRPNGACVKYGGACPHVRLIRCLHVL